MHTKKSLLRRMLDYKFIYLLGLPGMVIIFLFSYLPMYGILSAFQDYNPYAGISGSEWVGFEHFAKLFQDPEFFQMFGNTLLISAISLLTFPFPILFALLLNEVRNAGYRKFVQTTVYMPHFLSWTVVFSLTYILLSNQMGLINKIIEATGGSAHSFLFDKNAFYWIYVIQNVWRNIGWNSIVYLAAISGVDPSLYEAAIIDGASKLQQIRHITLPSIMPTVIVMLILRMGSIISVDFEQVLMLDNAMIKEVTNVFDIYTYNVGVLGGQYSYTAAIGIFKSVISVVMVLSTNKIAEKFGHEGII